MCIWVRVCVCCCSIIMCALPLLMLSLPSFVDLVSRVQPRQCEHNKKRTKQHNKTQNIQIIYREKKEKR